MARIERRTLAGSPVSRGFIRKSKLTLCVKQRRQMSNDASRSNPRTGVQLGLTPEIGCHAIDNFREGRSWPESGKGMQLIDARHAAHHVFKTGLVSLIVRNEFDRGGAAGALLHEMGKRLDGNLLGIADVDDLPHGFWGIDQPKQGFDGVAHVTEATRLLAGAVNGDGFAV